MSDVHAYISMYDQHMHTYTHMHAHAFIYMHAPTCTHRPQYYMYNTYMPIHAHTHVLSVLLSTGRGEFDRNDNRMRKNVQSHFFSFHLGMRLPHQIPVLPDAWVTDLM